MEFSRPEYWSGSLAFSRGSSQPRDRTQASRTAGRFFTSWATREAQIFILDSFQFKLSDFNNFSVFQRDGCPKIVNLGSSKTDLFYERKKYGFKKRWLVGCLFLPPSNCCSCQKKMPTTANRKEAEHRASPELPISIGHLPTVSSHLDLVGMEERFFAEHSGSFSIRKNW